jgi:glucokinase
MVYHMPVPRKNPLETQNHFRDRRYEAIKKAIKNLCQETRAIIIEHGTLADATAICNEMIQVSNLIVTAAADAPTARLRNRLNAWGVHLGQDFNDVDAYRNNLQQQQVINL